MKRSHLVTFVGVVIALAAGGFLVRAIVDQWAGVRSSIGNASPAWLVAGALTAAAGMVAIALPWRTALALVGIRVGIAATVVWYFVGEIGKYLPGGVWPVVGRAELARGGGNPRSSAYASVALSLGALYLTAVMLCGLLLPLRFAGSAREVLWILPLAPIGLAMLHPRVLNRLLGVAERVRKAKFPVEVPNWSASMRLLLRYVPSWLLIGTATWFIARAFDPRLSWTTVAPAAICSWVIGFVLVPVPGGVGVREAAFVALIGGSVPSGTRATIAIAARLSFMLVDGTGALLCSIALRRWRAARVLERDAPAAL